MPVGVTGIGELFRGAYSWGFVPECVGLLLELELLTGDVDDLRLELLRILCSDKGKVDEGSLAMTCRPEWPAV